MAISLSSLSVYLPYTSNTLKWEAVPIPQFLLGSKSDPFGEEGLLHFLHQ